MFTGLIEEVGTIHAIHPRGDGMTLVVEAKIVLDNLQLGDSICISGACQTVVGRDHSSFTVEAVQETIKRTRFVNWKRGDRVNLERAMLATSRFGGHIVQGHVDALVSVARIQSLAGSWRLILRQHPEGKRYIIEKGSVALDGVSLTIATAREDTFEVEIIPYTWTHTTLNLLKPGETIHAEWDILAKYVERMLYGDKKSGGLTLEKLRDAGFKF